MDLTVASVEKAALKSNEYRKVIKPLLERRRRARINNCLDELKALIMETAQTENSDASKLEKADILELTVQHLRRLRTQNRSWTSPSSPSPSAPRVPGHPSDIDRFRAGFSECAREVSTYVSAINGVDTDLRVRLLAHLAQCIGTMSPSASPAPSTPPPHLTTSRDLSSNTTTTNSGACLVVSSPTPPPSPISPLTCTSSTTPCLSPGPQDLSNSSMSYVWPEMMSPTGHHQLPVQPVVQQLHPQHHHHHQRRQSYKMVHSPVSWRNGHIEDMDNMVVHHNVSSQPWRPW